MSFLSFCFSFLSLPRSIQILHSDCWFSSSSHPAQVDCELTEDLVDSCLPGDVITVVGVVKAFKADGAPTSRDKNKSLFLLYVDAKSVSANDKVCVDG